jgi:Ca-activated chloride channel family protein
VNTTLTSPGIRLSAVLVWFAVSAITTVAQQISAPLDVTGSSPDPGTSQFTISKNVDEVNIVFTVRDSHSHLFANLATSDFELFDNRHAPRRINYFQQESTLPLRIGLLIDNSSSIRERFDFEKKAAALFLKRILRPTIDKAFVVAFDDRVRLLHDFDSNADAIEKSIGHLKPGGSTALYDAVLYATDKLQRDSESIVTRRVIILITDGNDTQSHALLYDTQLAPERADVIVYALSTNDVSHDYPKGEAVLALLTKESGGRILPAHEKSELNHALAEVEKELRSQYALGYTPAEFKPDGAFHMVEIRPQKPGVKVLCRRGYFATRRQ